jgi:hypothetical protein
VTDGLSVWQPKRQRRWPKEAAQAGTRIGLKKVLFATLMRREKSSMGGSHVQMSDQVKFQDRR